MLISQCGKMPLSTRATFHEEKLPTSGRGSLARRKRTVDIHAFVTDLLCAILDARETFPFAFTAQDFVAGPLGNDDRPHTLAICRGLEPGQQPAR